MTWEALWQGLERLGSMALLALVLWGAWKYLSRRADAENNRLDKLVEFVQNQVQTANEAGREQQELWLRLSTHTIEALTGLLDAATKHESASTSRHDELVDKLEGVVSRISKAVEEEITDAGVDG